MSAFEDERQKDEALFLFLDQTDSTLLIVNSRPAGEEIP
jgi:hypothetical protein